MYHKSGKHRGIREVIGPKSGNRVTKGICDECGEYRKTIEVLTHEDEGRPTRTVGDLMRDKKQVCWSCYKRDVIDPLIEVKKRMGRTRWEIKRRRENG